MALIDHIYKDPALTDQFDDATDTLDASAIQPGTGAGVFYVGTPTAANKIEAASAPGIDPIQVSITDNAGQVNAADIKLSLTPDFSGSIGGAPLNLGATINGAPVNAVAVHYEWTNDTGSGTYTNVTLDVVERVESAI